MRFFLLLLLAVLCPTAVLAAPKTFTITDHLGLDWTNELVHYPLTFAPGEWKSTPVVKVEALGQPITSQVSDLEQHEDGSIKSCKVWFFADVPANGAVTYTLTHGTAGPKVEGVTVALTADVITLSTLAPKSVGIRLLNGSKTFAEPAPASEVPSPIQGLLLPSGKTVEQGKLSVPFKVKSYTTELLANGPLFAEARTRYVFDTGYWNFTARVVKGSATVIIHEEFNTGFSDQASREADRFFTLTLKSNDFSPSQFFFTGNNDQPELATLIKNGIHDDWKKFGIRDNWFASRVQGGVLPRQAQELYRLLGYPSGTARIGTMAQVQEENGDAIGITALDTAYWREPLAIRLRSTADGAAELCFPLQVYKQEWHIDAFGRGSPNYTGQLNEAPEYTVRRAYGIRLAPAVDEKTEMLQALFTEASRLHALPLDTVKEWKLDVPDPMADAQWAAESSDKGKLALATMRNRLDVTRTVGQWGRYSMAYHYFWAKTDVPGVQAVMNSTADLSAADRAELRRLAAWNAYDMHLVDTFPHGTGFHLNNPNMTIMAVEARTKASLLVKDHPQFQPWGQQSLAYLKEFNRRFTRDSGALYENPHYSLGVTLDWQAQANKILMDAGIGDAFDTPLMPKAMRFMMDWLTPPDPRFLGHRVVLPLGNGSYQSVPPSMATQFVTYYKDRNPELAGQLQWMANQTLPDDKKIAIVQDIVPQLGSVHYEDYGVSFRHGFGTPYETLFLLFAGNTDGHYEWESDQMTYTLYAKGQPINLHFGNGYFPTFNRPWLRNRVSIDHMVEESERNVTEVKTASFTPQVEYAHATREIDSIRPLKTEYPVLKGSAWAPEERESWPSVPQWQRIPKTKWHRQVLFMKDADPKGPNYFVLRDGFSGTPTRPTDLSLWFLANSMTREGDVFHFEGQAEVDLDLFVASPAKPEVETDKYGHVQQPYVRHVGFDPKYHPEGKLQETQLLLRLKQPAGKGYLVVLYPRLKAGDPPAKYTALADGAVRVETPLSTDYAFINSEPFSFKNEQLNFNGTAGSVRFYQDGKIVVTNTEGKGEYSVAGKVISGEGDFTVTIENGKATASDARKVTVK